MNIKNSTEVSYLFLTGFEVTLSQKHVLAQEIWLGSPDSFPRERVGSGNETRQSTRMISLTTNEVEHSG